MRSARTAAVALLLASALAGCGAAGGQEPGDGVTSAGGVVDAAPGRGEDSIGLTPAVRRSIDVAIAAAAAEGVALRVTSGWRSADEQQRLYDEALATYGSAEAARRWVLPPEESAHVRGEAVDVGPAAGAAWLQRHGERFGLCQRYDNEPWHFERLAGALGSRCPAREPHA